MKNDLRTPILEVIEKLTAEGLDLKVDVASMSVIYPEHPGVVINLSIGGMFLDNRDNDFDDLH